MRRSLLRGIWFCAVLAAAAGLRGEDAFYELRPNDLVWTKGGPDHDVHTEYGRFSFDARTRAFVPQAKLQGEGEVFLNKDPVLGAGRNSYLGGIVVRAPAGKDLRGTLVLPSRDWSKSESHEFTIAAAKATACPPEVFYRARKQHYDELLSRPIPGAAWFRYQSNLSAELGKLNTNQDPTRPRLERVNQFEQTFDLFTGGRALSENLQLDRELLLQDGTKEQVEVAKIDGITIDPIDWKPLLKGKSPQLDPLASWIPADQHVVFFPKFDALVRTLDELDQYGTPLLELAESRSEDALTKERYQRQLCLPMTELGKLIGGQMIRSVAITGSDPYFRTGTDVAVIFEAVNPRVLLEMLTGQATQLAAQVKDAGAVAGRGEIDGIAYRELRSPDRRICSYQAELDGAVIVTNSKVQLQYIIAARRGKAAAVAGLDEYAFFRDRYPLSDANEAALLFLSDATIRRWCGPKWRIAASRQTRDAAILANEQARLLDSLVHQRVKADEVKSDLPLSGGGVISADAQGIRSSTMGTLEFMTPIVELDLPTVSKEEAMAYERWRDGYQQNWRWRFDPVALKLVFSPTGPEADLTVMPLIAGSEYRQLINVSRDGTLRADAGDRHGALAHFALAIDPKYLPFAEPLIGVRNPFRWLGDSISVYVDDDPSWTKIAALEESKRTALDAMNFDWPIALRCDMRDPVLLTAFLSGLRAMEEKSAPGMLLWETLEYKEQPYVKVGPKDEARAHFGQLTVYYLATGDALLVTLNEDLLKRAIDRRIAGAERKKDQAPATAETRGQKPADGAGKDSDARTAATTDFWLGKNVGFQIDRKMLQILAMVQPNELQHRQQALSWSNLPILNEWRRLYPDQDPLVLHEKFWQARLICPGGGSYVWNDKWQTYESTVYGHPGARKVGPDFAPGIAAIARGNFGLTFENLEPGETAEEELAAEEAHPTRSVRNNLGLRAA